MQININNGAVVVTNSPDHTPRCLNISTHLCGRTVEVSATHWPARDKHHERAAFISVRINAEENEWEAAKSEANSYRRPATEQTVFFDIEDARALRDALTVALDCVKS